MKLEMFKRNEAVAYKSKAKKTDNLNMRKIVFLFLVFQFILNIDANGQSAFEKFFYMGDFHNGFAVFNNGDTIKGYIIFDKDNYSSVKVKDTTDNTVMNYRPKDLLVFSFDTLYFYPTKFNKNKDVFGCLLLDDQIKIYLHRYQTHTSYYVATGTAYILEKPNGQRVQIIYDKRFKLKKHVGDFFKDCPYLTEKINDKTYQARDALKIAYEYNEWLKHN